MVLLWGRERASGEARNGTADGGATVAPMRKRCTRMEESRVRGQELESQGT